MQFASVVLLQNEIMDDTGSVFAKGSSVFSGNYFDFHKEMKSGSQYKLSQKETYVYADSVLYVGINLVFKKGNYFLNNVDHQDIMSVLF